MDFFRTAVSLYILSCSFGSSDHDVRVAVNQFEKKGTKKLSSENFKVVAVLIKKTTII
jgi:hypothetical protein